MWHVLWILTVFNVDASVLASVRPWPTLATCKEEGQKITEYLLKRGVVSVYKCTSFIEKQKEQDQLEGL